MALADMMRSRSYFFGGANAGSPSAVALQQRLAAAHPGIYAQAQGQVQPQVMPGAVQPTPQVMPPQAQPSFSSPGLVQPQLTPQSQAFGFPSLANLGFQGSNYPRM